MNDFPVVAKTELGPGIKKIVVKAPLLAARAGPGQFVILRLDPRGERIPLTISDFDRAEGTITLIFQEVGFTTRQLGSLQVGDVIRDLAGPLGKPARLDYYGVVLCVGGGVGAAPLYPIARALAGCGNRVVGVLGARSSRFLILKKEMEGFCKPLIITTDDGSEGIRGPVTEGVKRYLEQHQPPRYCVCIGPPQMMEAVCRLTACYQIKTAVSLNPIMVDGTGMCGACRVLVGGEVKFACVEGPEFDGHLVDWDLLKARLQVYRHEERAADSLFSRGFQGRGMCRR